MKLFLSLLLYGSGITFLGFMAGYPVIGFLLALFVVFSMYLSTVAGIVQGVEIALRNPPPQGKTRITLKVMNQEINLGESFNFLPPLPNGETNNFIINQRNKGGRPRGKLSSGNLTPGTTADDLMPFIREAKKALDRRDGSFKKLCESKGIPERTVRDWVEKYYPAMQKT